jgi:hypothetical protein
MIVPRVLDIIKDFKVECQSKGWKSSEHEDWIQLGNQYHNFLWTRTIHPSTFKSIAKASKCAILEGVSYRVVKVNYTAWLFLESPPEELVGAVNDDPDLAKYTAIYDLSGLGSATSICVKYNLTDSKVFKGFEDFLSRRFGVEFKSPQDIVTTKA